LIDSAKEKKKKKQRIKRLLL